MSLARGLVAQYEVVYAIILRETRTRFGAHHLGYLWAFIEPLLWIATFYAMFAIVNRTPPHGMDIVTYLTTGIVPFKLFRETTGRSINAISANKALLFYPQIRPLDLVFARTILETATYFMVFAVILLGVGIVRGELVIDNLIYVFVGMLLAALLGSTFGLTLCALSTYSNSVERLASPLLRPLFWVSGLFFTANDLPTQAREILIWNPVLHTVELVRDGWFVSYEARHLNLQYVCLWILVLGFIGLTLERVARRRLEVT